MKIKLLIIALVPLLFAGCNDLFDKGDTEKVYDDPAIVGFFPLEQEATLEEGAASVEIQLIGEQRSSDLSVSFSVDNSDATTAVAGTHYNLVTSSPVTLASGTSTVDIQIELIEDSVPEGEEVVLILNLEGADDVPAGENLNQATIFIAG